MVGPCDNDDDQHIVHLLAEGRDEGVALLLKRYGGRITGYLERRFPSLDEHQVHDTVVDAVLALRQTYDAERAGLGTWFLFLAHQQAVNRLRASKSLEQRLTREHDPESAPDHRASPTAGPESQEFMAELTAALGGLSDLERAVVEADLEAGAAAAARDLAGKLETSERSVYSARTRARRKLARRLARLFPFLSEFDD